MNLTNKEREFLEACRYGDIEKVRELIVKIDSINYYDDEDEHTPLMESISQDNLVVTKFLLQNGANIEHSHFTYNVIIENILSVAMLDLLVEYGLNIHYNESEKKSPLYFFARYFNHEVACRLIDLGVKYEHLELMEAHQNVLKHVEAREIELEKQLLDNQILVRKNAQKIKL